ncbi:MAG: hypothetical protein GTO02_06565 [Candidatus Dadabacteria bacterium]|nr:hypothetical protein [Candidatus Dadabacteria bacterium]NIQ14064.1 hypothetical protein [Candidatus Dadabacteria bacterium]
MNLILVRHGKTNWNELGRCQGVSDIPLNQNGLAQADKLAYSLKDENLDVIYSSDLQRAVVTAQKVAEFHSLEVNIENKFREMDQGEFEGLDFSYIREKYSDVLKHWRESPETLTIPGGESLTDVQNRAYDAVLNLIEEYNSKTVLVVSHNLTIITLLCKFHGKSMKSFREFMVSECSKSIIEFKNGDFHVKLVNDISHL